MTLRRTKIPKMNVKMFADNLAWACASAREDHDFIMAGRFVHQAFVQLRDFGDAGTKQWVLARELYLSVLRALYIADKRTKGKP